MKPNYTYKTEAEIPEDLKDRYVKGTDGSWTIDIEGAAPKAKLEEFRDNNVRLQKENDTFKETFKDLDPEKAKAAMELVGQLDEKQLVKAGDIAKQIDERTAAMKAAHEKQVAELEAKAQAANNEISRLRIDTEVLKLGSEHGLREGAATDLVARAAAIFKFKDGNVVAEKPDGSPIFNDKSEGLTIEDWVKKQATGEATHLFDPSSGGGAMGGGNAGAAFNGANPWDPKTLNLTEQMKLLKSNAPLARRLASKHGAKLPDDVTPLSVSN